MRLMLIGDVFGRAGRKAVRSHVPRLVREHDVELVVANAENAAGGAGLTGSVADELFAAGAHCLTGGNHTWDKREVLRLLDDDPRILRPLNYPAPCPGAGVFAGHADSGEPVAVINLIGRIFMSPVDCPFRAADDALRGLPESTRVILVDVHGEASSEKAAMARYLDGRVTAVLGTHTHVATADARILPGGTAFQTDVGMTGPYDSIIGMDHERVLERFLTSRPVRFQPAEGDPGFRATIVEADSEGRAVSVERVALGGGGR